MAGTLITTQLDPADLHRLMRDIHGFRPALSRNLRRRWWDSTRPMVAAMRRDLGGGPKAEAIGAAIHVSTTERVAGLDGISVELRKGELSESERVLARKWDSPKDFRHPVFGNRAVWVTQARRPWWYRNVKRFEPKIKAAAGVALAETVASMGRGL